jgi:hypothetical protein
MMLAWMLVASEKAIVGCEADDLDHAAVLFKRQQ